MEIRVYEPEDKHEVVALWSDCGLIVPQNDPSKDIERKQKVDPDLFLVGVYHGVVIATVMGGYEGHRGWINYLAVSPNHQRKGHGQAMMRAVEQLIRKKGAPKINLQVRSDNDSVIAFYQAIGYGRDQVVGLGKRLEND